MSINYAKGTSGRVELGPGGSSVVSFQPQDETLTYERHFGLIEKPFSLNTDPRFVFESPAYAAAYEALLAGLRRREGLLVLTGEIGAGKTTVCRAVLRDLGRKTYSSLVPDPFASREDLLKMLLIDFGVLSIHELTSGPLRGATRTELGYVLSEFLDSLSPEVFVVVVIDEAQNLSLPLIEETRILADTFGARGRLQLVFVGQPELHAKLKLPEMRQVDQRVCGYHRLGPLGRDEVAGYIQHRLQVAGHRDSKLFPPAVIETIHQRTGGVPRLINRLCDSALRAAHERQSMFVDRETLHTALGEVGATTLLPTWDAIVAAPPPKPAPATPAVPAPPPLAVESIQWIDDDMDFRSEIADWVEKELAPHANPPSALRAAEDEAEAKRHAATRTAGRESTFTAHSDWPSDLRSETYIERLMRVWGRRAAMVVAAFVVVNVVVVAGTLVIDTADAPALPSPPVAPAVTVPLTETRETRQTPTEAPPETTTAAVNPAPAVASASPAAAPGEFFVAVGLFSSTERADRLVEVLTEAGLPAMQRAQQFRQRPTQQIVLGPFFSRADAVADLRRLQALGGYDDARVVTNTR